MTKQELKLKHLAPYLPYGLKIYSKDNSTLELNNLSNKSPEWVIDSIKPILRPLSDLTKEIEHNGEKFVPIEKIVDLLNITRYDGDSNIKIWYEIVNGYTKLSIQKSSTLLDFMYKYHFDVGQIFNKGLIPAGLAIDINTIKP